MTDEVAACSELMEKLFYQEQALYRGYVPIGEPTVVSPGRMFRAVLHRKGDDVDRREVTVYQKVHGFAGELWERSARTLIRMRSLRHPGLPFVRKVKNVPEFQVAFTMTEQQGDPVDPMWLRDWARKNPVRAFEEFSVLLDALRQLHGARILHRGLTPGAFRMRRTGLVGAEEQLSLAGFEMSMLIGNLVRRIARTDVVEARNTIRAVHLTSTPLPGVPERTTHARHICYLPPETHDYLFAGLTHTRRDWESTDVFGLGVFGWELFCGPLAEVLPEEFDLVADNSEGLPAVRALARLHEGMRVHLRRKADLPQAVRDVLLRMIDHRPDGRRTTFEVALDLDKSWDTVRSSLEVTEEKPYLVAIMPDRSVETLYTNRRWLTSSPNTPVGRDELLRFMKDELSEASLVRSLNGARGYATGPDDKLAAAKWVLIGKKAVWFCELIRDVGHAVRDEILLVKYLTEHELAGELYEAIPRRRVPAIEVMSFRDGQSVGHRADGKPSWRPLLDSLDRAGGFNSDDMNFLATMDFLLEYQRIASEARIYPVEIVGRDYELLTVRLDAERDDWWRHRSHLVTAYMSDPVRRPRLGDFLTPQDADDQKDELALQLDRRITFPAFGADRIDVTLVAVLDPNTVRLRLSRRQVAPERGWIRLAEDGGIRAQQRREIKARQMLQSQPGLVQTLRSPQAFELNRHRWELDPELRETLRGNSPDIITNILATEPFYALQGPPGSGKTTAVSHALRLYLERMRGARVLVTAQSNFALDNIAETLLERMPDELMLRETSEHDGGRKVSKKIEALLLENVSASLSRQIEEKLDERLSCVEAGERNEETKLLREWRDLLTSVRFELSDRVRNGASVVLATSSIAAELLQRSRQVDDAFDWVIVEEAAKAWPTEIMIPLVLGTRWTLIGDHRQLGAHRSSDLKAFLESLEGRDEVETVYQARHHHLRWLALFKSFFDPAGITAESGAATEPPAPGAPGVATGRLNTMFRMHPALAEPIRRNFYPREPKKLDDTGFWVSDLEPDREVVKNHDLSSPEEFVGHALIWVDTEGMDNCRSVPFWSNDGEVEVVERIVASMQPPAAPPGEQGRNSLAVLTLYQNQRRKLDQRGLLTNRVFTVHSFQGREADRVVVSLVRDQHASGGPRNNVGLLAQDEVVNVLLSRAKSLLVLVGHFGHFEENAGPVWNRITRMVDQFGHRVHAEEWDD